MRSVDDNNHANAIVEGAVHLEVGDGGGFLQPGKQLGPRPAALFQVRGRPVGQLKQFLLD